MTTRLNMNRHRIELFVNVQMCLNPNSVWAFLVGSQISFISAPLPGLLQCLHYAKLAVHMVLPTSINYNKETELSGNVNKALKVI
jgi:hypothetical protein